MYDVRCTVYNVNRWGYSLLLRKSAVVDAGYHLE